MVGSVDLFCMAFECPVLLGKDFYIFSSFLALVVDLGGEPFGVAVQRLLGSSLNWHEIHRLIWLRTDVFTL